MDNAQENPTASEDPRIPRHFQPPFLAHDRRTHSFRKMNPFALKSAIKQTNGNSKRLAQDATAVDVFV